MFDNIFSKTERYNLDTHQIQPEPLNEGQLDYLKKKIIRTYLFFVSHTAHDSKVVEVMKLAALADVQRRYEAGEPR